MQKQLRRAPFVRFLAPAVAGILWAEYFPQDDAGSILIVIISFWCILLFLHYYRQKILFTCLFVPLTTGIFYLIHIEKNNLPPSLNGSVNCIARSIEEGSVKEGGTSFLAEILVEKQLPEKTKLNDRICLVKIDSCVREILPGDYLIINGYSSEIRNNRNPGDFNYQLYASRNGFKEIIYVREGKWKKLGSENSFKRYASVAREGFLTRLKESGLAGNEFAVATALLVGEKDFLGDDLRISYAAAGAMHVLAVSGLHVGVIFMLLMWLFKRKMFKKLGLLKLIILIACLWGYAFITGLSPSVCRSAFMFSFVAVSLHVNRRNSVLNTLAGTAFILLIVDSNYLFNAGFQLSFLAVFGIVKFQPLLQGLWIPPNRALSWAWSLSTVAVTAQLFTYPVALYYFNQFPNYFLPANFLVIPLAVSIIYAGVFFTVLSLIPGVSSLVVLPLRYSIELLNGLVGFIESLPWSVSRFYPSVLETVLLLLLSVAIGIFPVQRLKALKIIFFMIIVLQLTEGYDEIRSRKKYQLVLYSEKEQGDISWINAGVHLYIDFRSSYQSDLPKRYHVLGNPYPFTIHANKQGCILLGNEKKGKQHRMAILGDAFDAARISELKQLGVGKVILDASINTFRKKRMIKELQRNQLAYHDCKESGAFISN